MHTMDEQFPSSTGLAITWAGHSTVLIELDGVRLLTDPVVHGRVGPLRRLAPPVDPGVLDAIDAVLISHLHADHAHMRSLRVIGNATRVLAPHGAARWLSRHGFHDVAELAPGEAVSVGSVRVCATPAVHDPHRWHLGERGVWPVGMSAPPIGYLVHGSRSCYFAGDTDLFAAMAELEGSVDLALLPVSGWGAKVGSGHLDPARAVRAVALIAPRIAVPIHWGTLALALPMRRPREPARHEREFAALAAERVPDVEVRVLEPGERTQIAGGASGARDREGRA
jgi:L-ascorbate metabolism protein UlaG (beta-lactamase superfamily)